MSTQILTASGTEFDLGRMRPEAVRIVDISHALACINRFTGHARRPYSVAEHSLLVLDITERLLPATYPGLLAALMHDAHEAYVGDVVSPLKPLLGTQWYDLEALATRAVRGAFGLHAAAVEHYGVIRKADLIALATEREQLLPGTGPFWPCLVGVNTANWVDLMAPERQAMTWSDWAERFADAFEALEHACRLTADGGEPA